MNNGLANGVRAASADTRVLTFILDGAGTVLSTGAKAVYTTVPYAANIIGWKITALDGNTGSIQFDVWKSPTQPPVVANSIVASAPPLISSAASISSTNLNGWMTTVLPYDIFELSITSVTTFTKVKLEITLEKC